MYSENIIRTEETTALISCKGWYLILRTKVDRNQNGI